MVLTLFYAGFYPKLAKVKNAVELLDSAQAFFDSPSGNCSSARESRIAS